MNRRAAALAVPLVALVDARAAEPTPALPPGPPPAAGPVLFKLALDRTGETVKQEAAEPAPAPTSR